MAVAFRLPDLGEGITEAEIVEWLVGEGDAVKEHQPLLRVETDKALVEVPAPAAGRVGRIRHRPGDTVHVGDVLVWILAPGEDREPAAAPAPEPTGERGTVVGSLEQRAVDLPPPASGPAHQQALATPAVRRLARTLGVRLEAVRGSGAGGRVTEADVRECAEGAAAPPAAVPPDDAGGTVERIALRGIRRTVARRLKTAVAQAALATHMDDLDVTDLVAAPAGGRVFAAIVKAVALALRRHPRFNATLDDAHEEVLVKGMVNLGIAVDTEDGLMVPVVRDVDRKPVAAIAAEITELAAACRARRVTIAALRGSTFSVSNIGSLGGLYATPIPNYPEVAILATGRIVERLARGAGGDIRSRWVLPVSLSFDHRVLDGADAARFVNTLGELLATPAALD